MAELPDFIGSYRIIDKLGEGGFASVYLAHHISSDPSQTVALKVPNLLKSYARFQRETRAVAALNHPNIVRILDMGIDERTKAPFFTMEYIPGGTLRDKLATISYVSKEQALDVTVQIGAALTHAHERHILHRDVNPKNILLDSRKVPTRSILTDFGLVKPLSSDQNLTLTIGLIGAFHYFAPEQWNKETLTIATDIYALGITCFEMMAGQRPFTGDVYMLRKQHLYTPAPALSSVAPRVGPFSTPYYERPWPRIPMIVMKALPNLWRLWISPI